MTARTDRSDRIHQLPELAALLRDADHVDVKQVVGHATLREFTARALGSPGRSGRALLRARTLLARALRLSEPVARFGPAVTPEQVPFEPGAPLSFFTVRDGREDDFLLLEASDRHLVAQLAIAVAPAGDATRFDVGTIVRYRDWRGPVYFNLIRPFHHAIVARMARAGARQPAQPRHGLELWVPRLILMTGAAHVLYAFAIPNEWAAIARDGFLGAIDGGSELDDARRRADLWFLLAGPAMLALGGLARATVRETGTLPAQLGGWLLLIGVPMTVIDPASGGWLLNALGIATLVAALRR